MDLSREIVPVEQSPLFRKWKEGKLTEGTTLEFLDMLGAYAYTPARAIRARVALLENAASQIGRDDLVEFLKSVRKTILQRMSDTE